MNLYKMFIRKFNTTILFVISIIILFTNLHAGKLVVGYYPAWIKSTYPAGNINFSHLTHINHAFAWPDANGNILMYNDLIYPLLNQLAHQNNVKICISLGGWGNSIGFSPMVADSTKRAFFIDNLVNFIHTHNYDGVDIDWEHPSSVADRNNLTKLIDEMRDRFNIENPDWLITFAVGTSNWSGQWFDYSQLVNYVDWFNAMCYDFHGSWSAHAGHNAPLYQPPGCNDGAIDVGMIYLHNTRGIPKNQLTVGMPFYGKEFNSASLYGPFTGTVTDYLYSEIIPKMNGGWTYHWDNVSAVPYLTNSTQTKLITFDDTLSLRLKCEWIKNQNYLGGMIWALGQDLYNNSQVLLETIGNQLIDSSTTSITSNELHEKDYVIHKNYPNPFNQATNIAFDLIHNSEVRIDIYNTTGQLMQQLLNKQMNAGFHQITFNGLELSSGMYFYRLIIKKDNTISNNYLGKMLLLK